MKAYYASLGKENGGKFCDWFTSLDELRDWANELIECYDLSGGVLTITEGEMSNDVGTFSTESPRKVVKI